MTGSTDNQLINFTFSKFLKVHVDWVQVQCLYESQEGEPAQNDHDEKPDEPDEDRLVLEFEFDVL